MGGILLSCVDSVEDWVAIGDFADIERIREQRKNNDGWRNFKITEKKWVWLKLHYLVSRLWEFILKQLVWDNILERLLQCDFCNRLAFSFVWAARLSRGKVDLWQPGSVQAPSYDIFWIATHSQALLELPKALFKCCFQRVSPMQSHCVTFNEAVFYALGVAWVQVCILKGVSRLLISFIFQDGLAFESFASKHNCVEESNCVIWNLIRR